MRLSHSLSDTLYEISKDCTCARLLLRAINDSRTRRSLFLTSEPIGDYFSFRERDELISYMPTGRTQLFTSDGAWERKGRQEMKPAKWLRSMLSERALKLFKDSDFALFGDKFKAIENAGKLTFQFTAFSDGYNHAKYIGATSNTTPENIHSCMWGKDVAPFYEAFKARLLVAVDGLGIYHGRAVVWTLSTGEIFMDRVYADSPETTQLFLSHAALCGWFRKSRQSSGSATSVTTPNGNIEYKTMSVKAEKPVHAGTVFSCLTFYPYMDTFQNLAGDGATLRNTDDEAAFLLHCTDGSCEEVNNHEGEVEDVDGEWIAQDEAVEINGNYYHQDDDRIVFCSRDEEYILARESYTIELSRTDHRVIHRQYVTQN